IQGVFFPSCATAAGIVANKTIAISQTEIFPLSIFVPVSYSSIFPRSSRLFYHPVRSRQHIRRNRDADLLGGFQVDDQLKLGWLLHWKIGWLFGFAGCREKHRVGYGPDGLTRLTRPDRSNRTAVARRELKGSRTACHACSPRRSKHKEPAP